MRRGAALLAAALAAASSLAAWGAPAASLEGGPFLPYRVNRAFLRAEAGFRGRVEARGLRWDGGEVLLFSGEAEAATGVMEMAFYLDEDFRSLKLSAGTLEGPAELLLDLSGAMGLGAEASPPEREARRAMRELRPPPRAKGRLAAARRLPLEGLDLPTAAFRAAELLFVPPAPLGALSILTVSAIASAVAAALPRGGRARGKASLALSLGSAAALAVAACLLPPPPSLFSAAFPARDPSLSLSGALERRVENRRGYSSVEYALGAAFTDPGSPEAPSGGATLMAFPAMRGGGIPLEEALPPGALLRFSPPLEILSRAGELLVGGERGSIGWVLDESR